MRHRKKPDGPSDNSFVWHGHQKRAFTITAILLLVGVSIGVYGNTLLNGFVYDDDNQVLNNPWIKDIKYVPEIFTSNAWGFLHSKDYVTNYYRPMMHLIYMFDYFIFGLKPWGFHLVNVLFHCLTSVLVFLITGKLIESWEKNNSPQSPPSMRKGGAALPAFAAALLFAATPIHTEPVAWIAGVPEISYTFFFLLAFYFYIRAQEGAKGRYLLSILSFAISTLCKEPALILPFILMAYDYAIKRPIEKTSWIKRFAPYFSVMVVYMGLRFNALSGFSPFGSPVKLTPYDYLINVPALFTKYLIKLLLPLNLNAFYVFHPVKSVFEFKATASVIVTAAYIFLLYKTAKKDRMVFFGLLLIAAPLLPALYIWALPENVFSERYLYLPSFGFTLLVALAFSRTRTARPALFTALGTIIVLLAAVYSAGSIERNAVWRDDLTLFTDTVRKSPDAALPHYDLGAGYAQEKHFNKAISEYRKALSFRPNFAEAHYYIGKIYAIQNRPDLAINEYKAALLLKPDFAPAHDDLGNAYTDENRLDDAAYEYKAALTCDPGLADAYNNLGIVYAKENLLDEAIIEFKKALSINPAFAAARKNLEIAYSLRKSP